MRYAVLGGITDEKLNMDYVLRYNNDKVLTKLVNIAESMAPKCILGSDRNEAHRIMKKLKYAKTKAPDDMQCDPSAFITLCCIMAGISALEYSSYGNAATTDVMRDKFVDIGFRRYEFNSTELKKGDIILKKGNCAIVI